MGDDLVTKEIAECVAKSIGLSSFEIIVDKAHDRNGYLSEVLPVTLADKNSGQVLKLVIKYAKGAAVADEGFLKNLYTNEVFFYANIFPLFEELGNFEDLAPKYYLSSLTNKVQDAFLVFDDLKAQGFENLDKGVLFTKKVIEFVFTRYGKFHAFGYALKQKKPEFFEQIPEKAYDIFSKHIAKNTMGLHRFTIACLINDIKPALLSFETNPEILKKLDGYIEDFVAKFVQAVSSEEQYRTVLHGDCWSNNIMFKIKEGEPIDLRFVDWQLIRTGSPVCDLSYMLYSSCAKEVLDDLEQLLKVYHASLLSNLKILGYNADKILPFEELLKQWKSHAKFGMMMAVGLLKVKLTGVDPFKGGSLHNSDVVLDSPNFELYKKTIVNLLEHMHEWGAL